MIYKIFCKVLCFPSSNKKSEDDIKFAHLNFCFSLKLWYDFCMCVLCMLHPMSVSLFCCCCFGCCLVAVVVVVFVRIHAEFYNDVTFSPLWMKNGPRQTFEPWTQWAIRLKADEEIVEYARCAAVCFVCDYFFRFLASSSARCFSPLLHS